MAALLLFFVGVLLIGLLVAGVVYVVYTVREHMSTSPEAAKAIYDHVFLPVFIGVPESEETGTEKPASKPEPDMVVSPDDLAL